MARSITVMFTDAEAERMDLMMVWVQNLTDDAGEVDSMRDLVRRATIAYLDFHEKLQAGELDGQALAGLLLERVDGLDPLRKMGGLR